MRETLEDTDGLEMGGVGIGLNKQEDHGKFYSTNFEESTDYCIMRDSYAHVDFNPYNINLDFVQSSPLAPSSPRGFSFGQTSILASRQASTGYQLMDPMNHMSEWKKELEEENKKRG